MGQRTTEIGIGHYVRVLWRYWWLVVSCTVIGGLIGAGLIWAIDESYTARTTVNVVVISTDPFSPSQSASGLVDGRTESEIATSYVVIAAAAQSLDTDRTIPEVREAITATPITDATVIEIAYTDDSVESARAGADAVAASYLHFRGEQARGRLSGMIERIDERLVELRGELTEAYSLGEGAEPGSAAANQAVSDRESITIEINSLIGQRNQLESVDTEGGVVLTPAGETPVAVEPSKTILLASGVVAGGIFGVIAAFVLSVADRGLRRNSDVEKAAGVHVIGQLEHSRGVVPAQTEDLDALRVARERILAALPAGPNTLLFVDETRDGALTVDVKANLALVLSQELNDVVLVLPGVNGGAQAALIDALELSADGDGDTGKDLQLFTSKRWDNLRVLITGVAARPTESDELLTRAVRRYLEGDDRPALALLGLPPTASKASWVLGQRLSDASVVAATLGVTRSDKLASRVQELSEVEAEVVGVLTVRARAKGEAITPGSDSVHGESDKPKGHERAAHARSSEVQVP